MRVRLLSEYLPNFCLGRSFTFFFSLPFFFNKSSLHFLFPLGVANTRSCVDPQNKNRSQCFSSHVIDARSCVESQQSMKSRENLRVFFLFVCFFLLFFFLRVFFPTIGWPSMPGLLFGKMRFQRRLEGGNSHSECLVVSGFFVCLSRWLGFDTKKICVREP